MYIYLLIHMVIQVSFMGKGGKKMQIWKKALVVLVLASTVMGLAATQYAKLGVSVSANISTPTSLIQLMAGDGAVVGGGYILDGTTGTYTVSLGTFAQGFNKTYTAAFAIVNAEANVKLRITRIDVTVTSGQNKLVIALHKTMNTNVFTTPADGIIYHDKGTAYDYTSGGYVLANGTGTYDTSGSNNLKYATKASWPPNTGEWTEASWSSSNGVWIPGAVTDATNLGTDGSSGANFVWVQITIDESMPTGTFQGTIYIEVKSI